MNDKLQGERERFEARFPKARLERNSLGDYVYEYTQYAWTGWQACAALASDAEPVYLWRRKNDTGWLEALDEANHKAILRDVKYEGKVVYTAPPSTTQAVESMREKCAKEAEHWQEISRPDHKCGEYIASAIRAIPTDAAQVDAKPAMSDTWSLEENVKALLTNPVSAIDCFGYEWLTTVVRELAAQVERDAKDAELRRQRDKLLEACKRARANMPDGPCYQQLHAVIAEIDAAIASANREG